MPIEDHVATLSPGDFIYGGYTKDRFVCEVKEILPPSSKDSSVEEGGAMLLLYQWPAKGHYLWKEAGKTIPFLLNFSNIKSLLRPPYVYRRSSSRTGFVFKELVHLLEYDEAIDFNSLERYEDVFGKKNKKK